MSVILKENEILPEESGRSGCPEIQQPVRNYQCLGLVLQQRRIRSVLYPSTSVAVGQIYERMSSIVQHAHLDGESPLPNTVSSALAQYQINDGYLYTFVRHGFLREICLFNTVDNSMNDRDGSGS